MISQEHILQVLHKPHFSEKASILTEKYNTIVLKVSKNSTKSEIKAAVHQLFQVMVNDVRTLVIKGKMKHNKQRVGYRKNWKKAYITLKKGQKLDFISGSE